MQEIWKDIPGYEGNYKASNLGRIKSLNYKNMNKENILKQSIKIKYIKINLCVDGHIYTLSVHRLIAQTFIPNPENKLQVNHINGIRNDNRVENLEWCTAKENMRHKFDILGYKNNFQTNHFNLGKRGKENRKSIEVFQFSLGGTLINRFAGLSEAGRLTSIDQGSISKCCHGKYKSAGGFIWKFK